MPLTFSHPAAILPFKYLPRKWVSMTGLIAGSIVPDFEYFLRMKVRSVYSHTLQGVFWFDLPLAIILSVIFHQIVRDRLIENLPGYFKKRFYSFLKFEWLTRVRSNRVVFVVSVLVGIFSHILWDSFTHKHGAIVESVDMLGKTITIGGYGYSAYKILQHLSSLAGAALICYSVSHLQTIDIPEYKRSSLGYWCLIGVIACLMLNLCLLFSSNYAMGDMIVWGISSVLIGALLTSIANIFLPESSLHGK